MRRNVMLVLGALAALLLVRNLYLIFLSLPDEAAQGAVYRIMYFHVPSWFTSFSAYGVAAVCGLWYLLRPNPRLDSFSVAAVEVGTVFTAVGLATGMIWARNQWGIWWTWDSRLTWALITWLMYAAALMVRKAIDDPTTRAKQYAVLNLFSFVSVIICYKAIDWWVGQHPRAVLTFRTGGGTIDPAMENMLYWNWLAVMLLAATMVMIRMRQEEDQRLVDSLRRMAHAF